MVPHLVSALLVGRILSRSLTRMRFELTPCVNVVVKKIVARASIGTGSLNRHMLACRKRHDTDRKV